MRKKTQRCGKKPNLEIIINVAPVIFFIVYLQVMHLCVHRDLFWGVSVHCRYNRYQIFDSLGQGLILERKLQPYNERSVIGIFTAQPLSPTSAQETTVGEMHLVHCQCHMLSIQAVYQSAGKAVRVAARLYSTCAFNRWMMAVRHLINPIIGVNLKYGKYNYSEHCE